MEISKLVDTRIMVELPQLYDGKAHKIHVGKDIENDIGNKIKGKNQSVAIDDNIIESVIALSCYGCVNISLYFAKQEHVK